MPALTRTLHGMIDMQAEGSDFEHFQRLTCPIRASILERLKLEVNRRARLRGAHVTLGEVVSDCLGRTLPALPETSPIVATNHKADSRPKPMAKKRARQ